MPFKHIVDNKKDIVVLKATGKVSVMDIFSEVQQAISTKRGDGITRRLIDMTDQEFSYNLEDAQKILKIMKVSANVLGSRKIAVLIRKISDSVEFEKILSLLSASNLQIRIFTDKASAAAFLNKSSKKKKKS